MIHTATLLHDDVVDESQLRRGHATANAHFGNPAAVADLPIGFIAQEAAQRGFGDFAGLLQRELGFGAHKFLLDDTPKPIPFAAPAGEPALRRCAERLKMDVAHSGFFDSRRELPLREAGPPRYWPVADVYEGAHPSCRERRDYVLKQSLLITDRAQRAAGHSAR